MYISRRFLSRYRYTILVWLACLGMFLFISMTSSPEPATPAPVTSLPNDVTKTRCHILIVVLSTPANRANRALLRRSSYLAYPWLYNGTDVDFRYVFILGKSGDREVDERAVEEAQQYDDVVIGGFKDSYSRLTHKVMWAFGYVLKKYDFTFCMKVDEDSFVNMSYLAGYLSLVNPRDINDFYAGKPRQGDLAVPKTGKFTLESRQVTEYIQYNLGGGYILSHNAMSRILATHRSATLELVPWEDVYVGMLAHVTGIPPIRIYHYYVSKFHPFCTDSQSKLLHHTPPDLQVRVMAYYDKHGKYCPETLNEEEVLEIMYSVEVVDWV